MEFFESSGSLTVALGKTLVHSLWIGLLLLSILKISLHAIPSHYSNSRYRLATIALLLFAASVAALFFFLFTPAITQSAEHHHTSNKLLPGALGQNQKQLFNRIKRILNQSTMKTNIHEKLFSLLLMAGGVIILLTISGFSSGFSIVKHNDSKQEANTLAVTSQLVQAPVPVMGQDTIPSPYPDTSEEIEQAEIEKEIEVAKIEALKALEEVDWEEIKKKMEIARQQVMESIDWEKLKVDLAETRIHVDSIMQDFDFDFDFDIDMEDIRVEMEEVIRELEEVDWEEIRTEIENVRIHLDSVLHGN